MSKIVVRIPIKCLPDDVLAELLSFCSQKSLENSLTVNDCQRSCLNFLYDYVEDMTEFQSDAVVHYAHPDDINKEIDSRNEPF